MIHHYSYHTTVTLSMFARRLKPTVVVLKESLEARDNFESLFSSVGSTGSEDDEEEASSLPDKNSGDETIIKWARENKNDWLPIIGCYHALPLPLYEEKIIF